MNYLEMFLEMFIFSGSIFLKKFFSDHYKHNFIDGCICSNYYKYVDSYTQRELMVTREEVVGVGALSEKGEGTKRHRLLVTK